MSEIALLEISSTILNIHVILLSFNGRLSKRGMVASLFVVLPLFWLSLFPQTLAGKVSVSLFVPLGIMLPLITVKGIKKTQILYISLFYIGFSSAAVMPFVWLTSSFIPDPAPSMFVSAILNIVLTAFCLYLSKKGILREILRHTNLVSKRIKIIILLSIWICALLIFLMAELFYEFPRTGPLNLIQILVALVISIIGISEPLLIINNITGTYYKIVSSSIQKQMEQQVKYYERLYQTDDELRRFKHDYKNLQIGLISHLKSNNVAAALQYLENCERPYTKKYITFETGNSIADALLSEKQLIAMECHTTLLFEGFIPNSLIDPCDICIILGNALDNAIEACLKIDNCVEKQISIQSYLNNNFLFLSISNPSFTPVDIKFNRISTTKRDKDSHGLGLYAIEHSVKSYAGEVKLSWNENIFRIDICLDFNTDSIKDIA